jgi:Bacterial SH3 domain
VSRARHSRARHRSPRIPSATGSLSLGGLSANSRFVRLSAAGAVVASLGAGTVALAGGDAKPEAAPAQQTATETPSLYMRQKAGTSRNVAARPPVKPTTRPSVRKPPASPKTTAAAPRPAKIVTPKALGTNYVTTALNVRTGAGKHFPLLDQLSAGDKVAVTGKTSGDWTQVLLDEKPGWVASQYLSTTKPSVAVTGGISSAPCPDGSAVEDGLRPDTIRVHRAVCALFPGVKTYGGLRGGGGEHSVGRALDIMVGFDSDLGQQIADWVRAHHKELGVSEVIWAQHIWTVQRSSEGWRPMEDRGSATANHYDHVHVTTYGDAGTA